MLAVREREATRAEVSSVHDPEHVAAVLDTAPQKLGEQWRRQQQSQRRRHH